MNLLPQDDGKTNSGPVVAALGILASSYLFLDALVLDSIRADHKKDISHLEQQSNGIVDQLSDINTTLTEIKVTTAKIEERSESTKETLKRLEERAESEQ